MIPLHGETFVVGAGIAAVALVFFVAARLMATSGDDELGTGPASAKTAGIVACLAVGGMALLVGLWLLIASYSDSWGR